jgi:hypothetical protein
MCHSPLTQTYLGREAALSRSYETATKFQLTVLDWDKLASNDYIADASSDFKELLDSAMTRRGCMRLARMGPMKVFKVAMSTVKEMPWEAKHGFVVTFWWVAFMPASCLSICKLTGWLRLQCGVPSLRRVSGVSISSNTKQTIPTIPPTWSEPTY